MNIGIRIAAAGLICLAVLWTTSASPQPQDKQAALKFEVATIRPSAPPVPGRGNTVTLACHGTDGIRRSQVSQKEIDPPLGRCLIEGPPLAGVIGFAFDTADSISGGSEVDAILRRPFRIEGKADDPSTATRQQLLQMLQTMLLERFRLRIHRETEQTSGYTLLIDKNGLKLKSASGGDDNYDLKPDLVNMDERGNNGNDVFQGKTSIRMLVQIINVRGMLSTVPRTAAPLVDKTGLTGDYEIRMVIPRAPGSSGQAEGDTPYPIRRFEAVQDQLSKMGLRLQAAKIDVEKIVVDHLENPSLD